MHDPAAPPMVGQLTDPVAVFGVATPYAWEVVETLWRMERDPTCVDNHGGADGRLPGLTPTLPDRGTIVIGPSTPQARASAAELTGVSEAERFPAVIDPTAAVARTARIGHGAYVNALVSVGAHSQIGCFVNLNRSVSVGHHCDVGPFTSTGPNITLCGNVTTGIGVFLGAGSVVLPERTVGSGSIVGAGAVVTRDVPEGVVVVGNPARVVGDSQDRIDSSSCPLCRVRPTQ